MLPEFLYDSYRQYKADTNQFVAWLTETAHQCGYPASSSRTPKVALSELLPQARCIAVATSPSIKIPSSKIELIQRVITARTRCTEWFEKHPDTKAAEETRNQAHSHFTGVLEKVMNILQPRSFHQAASSSSQSVSSDAKQKRNKAKIETVKGPHSEEWRNPFEQLTVDEPSFDDLLELPKVERATFEERPANNANTTQDDRNTAQEIEAHFEEVRFAFFCLLEDLQQIRLFLRETWSRYRSCNVSLMNASVITNAANQFVRRLELGIFAQFSLTCSWEDVMQRIFPTAFKSDGIPAVSDQLELLQYVLYPPFIQLLVTFHLLDKKNAIPPPSWDCIYDPRADRASYDPVRRGREDMILMSEMIPDLFLLAKYKILPAEDELTWGIRRLLDFKEVELSMCFALQVFVDINHELGEEVTRGFKELQKTSENHFAILTKYAQRIENLDEFKEAILPNLEFFSGFAERWIRNDGIMAHKTEIHGSRIFRPVKPHLLLLHHPVLCGLLTFASTLKIQQVSLLCEMKNGAIMATAHLYNAVQQDGLLELSWPDMDTLIGHQTAEKIFLGQAPTTPDIRYRRYRLIEGTSVQVFARNRRKYKMNVEEQTRSKKGARGLAGPAPVLELFRKQFCSGDEPTNITIDHIEAFLNSRVQDQQKKDTGRGKLREQWRSSHRLRPLELLAILQECLVEEEPALTFDYFTLNLHCWDVLSEIEILTRDAFAKWWGPEKAPVAFLLHSLPEYIFEFRAGEHGPRGITHGKSVLSRVAQMIRGCIEQQQRIVSQIDRAPADDASFDECIPEKGPTTLWGILEPNHPTRNGECIHIGVCSRQREELVRANRALNP